jgi:hypothetical protein
MKKLVIGTTIILALATTGGIMAINNSPEPTLPSAPTQQAEPTATVSETVLPQEQTAPVIAPTNTAPETPPAPTQEPVAPQVDQTCLDAQTAALAPLKAKLDDINAAALAHRNIGWNYTGTTTPMSEEDLDKMIDMKFGSIIRRYQQEYDTEAVRFDC